MNGKAQPSLDRNIQKVDEIQWRVHSPVFNLHIWWDPISKFPLLQCSLIPREEAGLARSTAHCTPLGPLFRQCVHLAIAASASWWLLNGIWICYCMFFHSILLTWDSPCFDSLPSVSYRSKKCLPWEIKSCSIYRTNPQWVCPCGHRIPSPNVSLGYPHGHRGGHMMRRGRLELGYKIEIKAEIIAVLMA